MNGGKILPIIVGTVHKTNGKRRAPTLPPREGTSSVQTRCYNNSITILQKDNCKSQSCNVIKPCKESQLFILTNLILHVIIHSRMNCHNYKFEVCLYVFFNANDRTERYFLCLSYFTTEKIKKSVIYIMPEVKGVG